MTKDLGPTARSGQRTKSGSEKSLTSNAPSFDKTISVKQPTAKKYKPRCSWLTKILGFPDDESAISFYQSQIRNISNPNFGQEIAESGMAGLGALFG